MRSDAFPFGLSGFRVIDQDIVINRNSFARYSFITLQLCYALSIAACMENPVASRIWQMPQALQPCFKSVTLGFWMCGTPWRKRTEPSFLLDRSTGFGPALFAPRRVLRSYRQETHDFRRQQEGHRVFSVQHRGAVSQTTCSQWARCFENNFATRALSNLSNLMQVAIGFSSGQLA